MCKDIFNKINGFDLVSFWIDNFAYDNVCIAFCDIIYLAKANFWTKINVNSIHVKQLFNLKIFMLYFKFVDTPLIVSRDQLLIINPTERPHRICHNVTLSNLTTKYRKTLWPVLNHIFRLEKEGTFGFDMSSLEQGFYHGKTHSQLIYYILVCDYILSLTLY